MAAFVVEAVGGSSVEGSALEVTEKRWRRCFAVIDCNRLRGQESVLEPPTEPTEKGVEPAAEGGAGGFKGGEREMGRGFKVDV